MPDVARKQFAVGLGDAYTQGVNSIYNGGAAVAAARRIAVTTGFGVDQKPTNQRVKEARGTYAAEYGTWLQMWEAEGKWPSLFYPDEQRYVLRSLLGAPTVATLPTVPPVLLPATALAVGGNSLTTQPTAANGAKGAILALTLANATTNSTPVTLTITGTAPVTGAPLTEVVVFGAGIQTISKVGGGAGATTVTLYTQNYFASVGALGIASSAQPASDTLAVGAVYGFVENYLNDMGSSTLLDFTGEYFDGSIAWQLLGLFLQKGDWKASIGKELSFDGSFAAKQKKELVATAASINPGAATGAHDALTSLPNPVLSALATRNAGFYSDPIGTAAGTTLINARLLDFALSVDAAAKLGKAADQTPYANFVGRDYYALKADCTFLTQSSTGATADPIDLYNFESWLSRTIYCAFPGDAMPCGVLTAAANWPTQLQQATFGGYFGAALYISGKWTVFKEAVSAARFAVSLSLDSEVDQAGSGAAVGAQLITRLNPNI